jgi:hypothetical protein
MNSYDRATSPSERTVTEQSRLADDFMERKARSAKIIAYTMELFLKGTTRETATQLLRTMYRFDHLADAVPSNTDPSLSPPEAVVAYVYPKIEERRTMGEMMKRLQAEKLITCPDCRLPNTDNHYDTEHQICDRYEQWLADRQAEYRDSQREAA